MRVIAIIAAYNEQRFIDSCLSHLAAHGVDAYLIDDGSTDDTVEIAERWLGKGLVGIERTSSHEGRFSLQAQLARKEQLARELDADWFLHLDADEIRIPPRPGRTLRQAFEEVGREGFNAVNFVEFTFVPTREAPDHDHRHFQRTLRSYYPFAPKHPHHVKAWKATDSVDLVNSNGHEVDFPGVAIYPSSFWMKHYLFLSVTHAIEKYVEGRPGRRADSWRSHIREEDIFLLSQSELRWASSDTELDHSEPRTRHYLADALGTRF